MPSFFVIYDGVFFCRVFRCLLMARHVVTKNSSKNSSGIDFDAFWY